MIILCMCANSLQSCLTLCDPMHCSPPDSSVHGVLQARILEWVAMPASRGFPNPWIKPRSPAVQADSLLSEPPGKPKNTGVGSLSLLQGIFPTQISSQPCVSYISFTGRWLLYHSCHLGNPIHDSYKAFNVIHSSEAQPWACYHGLTVVLAGLFFFFLNWIMTALHC